MSPELANLFNGGPHPAAGRRRLNDAVEADAAAGSQEAFAGPQDEEFGPRSTQHVCVDDGIEAVGSKPQCGGRGGDHAGSGGEAFAGGAAGGHA
jgi:hypothetical protein